MITWENKHSWFSPQTRRKSYPSHRLRRLNGFQNSSNINKMVLTIDKISERMVIAENGYRYKVTRANKDSRGLFHLVLVNITTQMPRIIVTGDHTREFKIL
jgi:hypothetical protein